MPFGRAGTTGWGTARDAVRAFRPDLVHAVGAPAVVAAHLLTTLPRVGLPGRTPVVASGVAGAGGWLLRRALRAAARVVGRTPAEADRLRAVGVDAGRLGVVPPGVSSAPPPPDGAAFRAALGIPPGGRLIVAGGRFDGSADLMAAAWAFDVVKYVAPDLYLVVVGDGPQRGRVERFSRAVGFDDLRARFAGPRDDLPALFGLAEVAWVTHTRGGVQTALEAMAAGVPVVGPATPDLAAVVLDGETGRLVPPGDRARLAAAAHELLADPPAARRLGAAGRDRAGREFSVERMVAGFAAVYDGVP